MHLFYSYSHADEAHQRSVADALALLRQQGLLTDWSDHSILPGQSISQSIRSELERADIICFLLSQHFIASDACMDEWRYAKALSQGGSSMVRVPIILSDCAWRDLLRGDDIKALPRDAKPIASFRDASTARQQIYEGLKEIVEQRQRTFVVRGEFIETIESTDLISQDHISLSDIFVFPNLVHFRPESAKTLLFEERVRNVQQLLELSRCVLHGDEMSGKTSIAKHVYLSLVEIGQPVLFIDLDVERRRPREDVFRLIYESQLTGDYDLWIKQQDKTVVLDNLTSSPRSMDYVEFAKGLFERILVTVSTDVFRSFYRDDVRLVDFKEVCIRPLSHVQQEGLIRRRLSLMDSAEQLADGVVDEVERRVNAAFAHEVVPRYPFYVLAVIQTFEGFMPTSLSVTSYGHCYYVMILARLTRCGISKRDEDVNACFNFAEHLALEIHEHGRDSSDAGIDLDAFLARYRKSFIFPAALFSRLLDTVYGLISESGEFRVKYMYHYFLGMYLSRSADGEARRLEIVDDLCSRSHLSTNHLTLMFTIHHATDEVVLDKIVDKITGTLWQIEPARLDKAETARFHGVLDALPESVLSEAKHDDVNNAA